MALSSKSVGNEIGPAILLPDRRVFQTGGNSNTALYTPATGSWVAGPTIPNGWAADDASGAELPNGHVIFAVDTSLQNAPTELCDFDPTTNTITQLTSLPPQLVSDLSSLQSGETRMLILPTGQLLLGTHTQEWVFTPTDSPLATSAPTISSIALNGDGTYTLAGTQLNGVTEGASYGDDAQMAENYPIVQLTNSSGDVYYARTFNWSSTGVQTGSTPVTTQFALPAGLPNGQYSLTVIADGIASAPVTFNQPAPGVQSVTIDNGTPQRSEVRSLTIDFGGTIVAAPSSAFTLSRTQDNLSIPVTASALTPLPGGDTQVVLTFSGPNLDGMSVPDGNYVITVDGSQIIDNFGQLLDAAGTGVAGSLGSINFFRLIGDANGDGIVNSQDLALVSSGWLTAGPMGDVNADNIVNTQDLALISSNWLATLPAAGAKASASATGADSAAQVAGTSSTGQSAPAIDTAIAVAVNTVVPASATSLSIGASSPAASLMSGLGSLKNAELNASPSSFVGPLQPDRVAAFLGPLNVPNVTATIDQVFSSRASTPSTAVGPWLPSGIGSLSQSQSAADLNDTGSGAVDAETVGDPWSSPIDDELLAILAGSPATVSRRSLI